MSQIPAGWYADPATAPDVLGPQLRWWDGAAWTEHVAVGGPAGVWVKTTPDGERLASWTRRLGAVLLDGLILAPVGLLLTWPLLVGYLRAQAAYMDEVMRQAEGGAMPVFPMGALGGFGELVAMMLIGLVVTVAYEAGFLRWKGATPGKLLLGLRVRLRAQPGRLPWSAIGKRLLVQRGPSVFAPVPVLSMLVGWFPLLDGMWPLWDDKNQALHDKAAGTNVVVRPAADRN